MVWPGKPRKSPAAGSLRPQWKEFIPRSDHGRLPPELPPAVPGACKVLEVTAFVEDLDRVVGNTAGDTLGLLEGAAARIWLHRFCALRDVLVLAVVAPVGVNFLALMGRRVRPLNLTDSQKRGIFLRARDFRPALKRFRSKDSASLAQVRGRGAVASSSPDKTSPVLNEKRVEFIQASVGIAFPAAVIFSPYMGTETCRDPGDICDVSAFSQFKGCSLFAAGELLVSDRRQVYT